MNITNLYGPLNLYHLKRIEQTIIKALSYHPRTLALRIDLRIPDLPLDSDIPNEYSFINIDSSVISRFIDSLKAKINADLIKKQRKGIRIHPCTLRYVWVREFNQQGKKHYHVLLLLNKDTYAFLGHFNEDNGTLVSLINQAWHSALRLSLPYKGLVHCPKNPCYYLYAKEGTHSTTYQELINRISYMAKRETKNSDDGERNFGCSQN